MRRGWESAGKVINWKKVGLGTGVCLLVTLVITGLFAVLMTREMIPIDWIDYLATISLLAGSCLGGVIVGKGRGEAVEMILVALCWFTILLGINAVIFDCRLSGILPVLLLILAGCVLPRFFMRKGSSRKNKRYRKRRTG